jgi:hypothetical protein
MASYVLGGKHAWGTLLSAALARFLQLFLAPLPLPPPLFFSCMYCTSIYRVLGGHVQVPLLGPSLLELNKNSFKDWARASRLTRASNFTAAPFGGYSRRGVNMESNAYGKKLVSSFANFVSFAALSNDRLSAS